MPTHPFPHPALPALHEAAGIHHDVGGSLTQRELFQLGLTTSATFAAACAAFLAVLNRHPAPTGGIAEILDAILQKVNHMDTNLDAIANDWPALKQAISDRLTKDADTIAKLTSELSTSATSTTPLTDERAAQIDSEMKAVLANLNGTAEAVSNASGPTPASLGSSSTSGSTSGSSAAGNASGSTTGGAGLATDATGPGAPPPGSAAGVAGTSPAAAPGPAETATTGAVPSPTPNP